MRVIESVAEANRLYESVDIEGGSYTFLDHRGCVLRPAIPYPSKKKWLLIFTVIECVPFTLELTNEKRADLIAQLQSGEISIDPLSSGIRSLAELEAAVPELFYA